MSVELWIPVAVFVFAGLIKGAVGLGLPTISLGLMTVFIGVEKAIVLILWPTLLTNIWQACYGGHFWVLVRRLWPFLLAAMLTLGLGTFVLTRVQEGVADFVLGILMVAYAAPMLAGLKLTVPVAWETPVGIVLGAINGAFSGFTGSYSVPGVMYLQALGLNRDELVQAMGLLFLTATIALALALGSFGLLRGDGAWHSLIMVPPALLGVAIGQSVRSRLSDAGFRRAFLLAILGLGLYLLPLGWLRMAA